MNYSSLDDIFVFNEQVRDKLLKLVAGLSRELADKRPEGEKWSPSDVVEHLALTEASMAKVCSSLLKKAAEKGEPATDNFEVSEAFRRSLAQMATKKVEAPEVVRPSGSLTIDDSLRAMEETSVHVKALREKLRLYDSSNYRFPHPYFGKLTAPEWLILIGQHEAGHIEQLERIVDSLKKTETFS